MKGTVSRISGAVIVLLTLQGCASGQAVQPNSLTEEGGATAVSGLVSGKRERVRLPCYQPDKSRRVYGGEYYQVRGGQMVRMYPCTRRTAPGAG